MSMVTSSFGVWTVKHLRLLWILVLLPVIWWAVDRAPPFKVVGYNLPTPTKAGEVLYLDLKVYRDVSRGCSVEWNRYLIDSNGVRHDYSGPNRVTSEGINAMDIAMKGRLKLAIPLPAGIPTGRATIVTVLNYTCNPLQAIWPIQVTTQWAVDVV